MCTCMCARVCVCVCVCVMVCVCGCVGGCVWVCGCLGVLEGRRVVFKSINASCVRKLRHYSGFPVVFICVFTTLVCDA